MLVGTRQLPPKLRAGRTGDGEVREHLDGFLIRAGGPKSEGEFPGEYGGAGFLRCPAQHVDGAVSLFQLVKEHTRQLELSGRWVLMEGDLGEVDLQRLRVLAPRGGRLR